MEKGGNRGKGGWGRQAGVGGRRGFQREVLAKTLGLYQVPKLRNLNFCCCTVCFLCLGGSGGGGWGFQRRKDYGLEVLAKTPGLYQVPKLRNFHLKKVDGRTDGPTDRVTYTSRWLRLKITKFSD